MTAPASVNMAKGENPVRGLWRSTLVSDDNALLGSWVVPHPRLSLLPWTARSAEGVTPGITAAETSHSRPANNPAGQMVMRLDFTKYSGAVHFRITEMENYS